MKENAMKTAKLITHSIDVSRRNQDDLIPGVLVLKERKGMTSREALVAFKQALAKWLTKTESGRRSWESSSHDFNYGDFRQDDVATDAHFRRLLKKEGLVSAVVERFEAEDLGETWDTVPDVEI